ncbi:MAG: S8 family serine peptidase [Clostridia bacterium]|nr:S8 family serine peptidase [Clostridia bacterium]
MTKRRSEKIPFRAIITFIFALFAFGAVFSSAAGGGESRYIIKYKESASYLARGRHFDVVSEKEMLSLKDKDLLEWYEPDEEIALPDETYPPNAVRTLKSGEEEPPLSAPSLYYASDKWDLALINAEPAFRAGALGEGVKVGVIDSGVNKVQFLTDSILPGACYIEGGTEGDTSDSYGHGTCVAALIAGLSDAGYIGAAPGAKIVPLKVTDGKYLYKSAVCDAIYSGIDDYGCKVLNLSLGITSDSDALREAVSYAAEKGVVMAAAVGNNGSTAVRYPAAYESVIGVGAVDEEGNVYYSSNRNESVFITAPGSNVKTAGKLGGYDYKSGTSFSTPFVSAAAAVMLGLDPELTPEEVATILAETARDAGGAGRDEEYGHGVLDLGACAERLKAEKDPEGDPPCEFISDVTLVNHTDGDIDCTCFLAGYGEDGSYLGVTSKRFILPARGRVRTDTPKSSYYGIFLCETESMTPIAKPRKN